MKDHSDNLGYWVKRYSLLVNQAMDISLRPYGIGRSQWYILYHLWHDGPLPQRTFQDILQIESATLTNLVAPLVKKNLVTQQVDMANKRNKTLQLTISGKKLWQELPNPIEMMRGKALLGINDKDIIVAREVLKSAVLNLEKEL